MWSKSCRAVFVFFLKNRGARLGRMKGWGILDDWYSSLHGSVKCRTDKEINQVCQTATVCAKQSNQILISFVSSRTCCIFKKKNTITLKYLESGEKEQSKYHQTITHKKQFRDEWFMTKIRSLAQNMSDVFVNFY